MHTTLWFTTVSLVLGCATAEPSNTQHPEPKLQPADYSSMVVLPYDTNDYWLFKGKCSATQLTKSEIDQVDALVRECIDQYMKDRDRKDPYAVARKGYDLQLVAVRNEQGEIVVWVNALCRRSHDDWRSRILVVMDGGNCYYQLKVNLTKKTFFDFGVNGYA